MGKFNFRLESLLNIVNHREEEAKLKLALCLQELHLEQEALMKLSKQQTQALRTLVESQKGIISIHKLISEHHYCQYLKSEVELKQRDVIVKEKKFEEAQNVLKEIVKKRKTLEKLKEKRYSDYISDEQNTLQKELDEIASNSFFTSAGGF
ncbi:MAG: flagellar export protein FliJ [Bacillota bacterium]